MSMLDWDEELAAVAAEATRLVATQGEARKSQRRTLVARKVRAVQAQIRLEQALTKLDELTAKDLLLLPREKAVLHWGRIYGEKARQHMELLARVLSKNLWLKLVRVRAGDLVEGDELVGLSVRQANLGKTERYLGEALKSAQSRQRQLVESYHSLMIERANREASVCMAARLGTDAEDAARSPIATALATYFMQLTASGRDAAASQRFFALHRRYGAKAQNLMSLCRNAVLGRGRDPADKVQATMRQLDALEMDIKAAYRAIVSDDAPPARPILVQSAQKPGKKAPHPF